MSVVNTSYPLRAAKAKKIVNIKKPNISAHWWASVEEDSRH